MQRKIGAPGGSPASTRIGHMCSVGGCGNAATHEILVDAPGWVNGQHLEIWLCDECDLSGAGE